MGEEFATAEKLLGEVGLLNSKPPVPIELVMEYLATKGLKLCYYTPHDAPRPIKTAASDLDEVLIWEGKTALLFVNQSRAVTRQRFSIFHGVGHFLLPKHRGINYLAQGCTTMDPLTLKPFERQADRFAAAINMPPGPFRNHMALLPFGMPTVENLAQIYFASIESAAIRYVDLIDKPLALICLEREYEEHGLIIPDSPLKVRYQVGNERFPFPILPGTVIPLENELFWACSKDEYYTEGSLNGPDLGLKQGTKLWINCLPQNHVGGVLALVYPGNDPPQFVIDPLKVI
jgi:hypothetical protein